MNKLDGYQKIDYALFIRPDLFSNEFIEAVKQKVVHTICAYQWDGMDRFPEVWRTVDLFDKFFVLPFSLSVGKLLEMTKSIQR